MSTDVHQNLSLTKEQAEGVIRKHLGGHEQSTVSLLTEIKNTGYRCATQKFQTILAKTLKINTQLHGRIQNLHP